MAKAMSWVSMVSSISTSMVLPGLIGYWVDLKLGTKVVFTCLGFGFGLSIGIWKLLQLTQQTQQSPQDRGQSVDDDGK